MTNPFAMTDPAPVPATAPVTPPAAPPAPAQPAADPYGDADPFANSDPAAQAPRAPRFRELYNRLVIIIPKRLEKGLVSPRFKNTDGSATIQDRMTADIIVLDGPTIHYGGEPEKIPPTPHHLTAEVPAKWADTFISFSGIISQCREALARKAQGQPGMVLGRLTKGQDSGKGNPPWILTVATDADKEIGKAYLHTVDPFA